MRLLNSEADNTRKGPTEQDRRQGKGAWLRDKPLCKYLTADHTSLPHSDLHFLVSLRITTTKFNSLYYNYLFVSLSSSRSEGYFDQRHWFYSDT